ncbi:glyceraldehyde-3-phosphate dehydrogenase, type I [Streptomyces alboflavus]|uniref:Glyceraldehyde-3-phosphate dehydrogenase, type I n=1 Tax=Streptomyces alboflavus TaxID=67267 RepID=A0A1Z1WQG6_9ACTN|nr:glyceraldehyde-3-phosphate dehydrogenase, type I [Streptomyces alboflavus]
MTVRVGINGFGRIGRTYLRCALERGSDIEVVAVNDIAPVGTMAHLLEYDSTYGRLREDIAHDDMSITVGGHRVAVTAERDPAVLDWRKERVDVVVESTGRFRDRDAAALHLKGGARKVLLSAPGKGADATVVMGVNHDTYDPGRHQIVSAASCTTNCVVPLVKVLHERFGIARGHDHRARLHQRPGTAGRPAQGPPPGPLRGAQHHPHQHGRGSCCQCHRAELDGALNGLALRVPVEDGSLTDLTVVLRRETTAEEINAAFDEAAAGELAGILRVSRAPIVSRDVIGDPASCVFDPALTQAHGDLVKVFGWYDNAWGYTNRLLDLTVYVADRL